jgi:uncharacterized protein
MKKRYLKVVEEHCQSKPELIGKFPGLRDQFERCQTKQELEDLYLPFKPKRRTRAQIAKEKGLEPLLQEILKNRAQNRDLLDLALAYVTPPDSTLDKSLHVKTAEEALAGAADIQAEIIAETASLRALVRDISQRSGLIVARKAELDEATLKSKKIDPKKYENYFSYSEPIQKAVSHRIMAVRRGEAEKVLKVNIEVDTQEILNKLNEQVIDQEPTSESVKVWLEKIVTDSYNRLISPAIETEIRLHLKSFAEEEAIKVFSKNLENLLLLPPLTGQVVIGVDPGLRTGSKLAVVSDTGKYLASATIYPNYDQPSSPKTIEAKATLLRFIKDYQVTCLAIGNGTGSREIDQFIVDIIRGAQLKEVKRIVVNEAGASVYSTDMIAREEFPDLDPTIRSAISIARRLQDPLAELVKIDPRSIGVGQYQHDCNVTKLNNTLGETVESCVNRVGVNLNTASYKLLSYVSGIGPTLAKNMVTHRNQIGKFQSREQIRDVSGFGPKAFEQAAGFLRVPEATNPLDNSSVHPERYEIVQEIAASQKMALGDLIGKREIIANIPWERYVTAQIGMPTLMDISKELTKPGRDPREDGARLLFSDSVSSMDDLREGMILKGTVSNVTNFGAFVDIGVHQDGLVHVSELSDEFIKDPAQIVSVGDIVDVRVIEVDKLRKRISLSCKSQQASAPPPQKQASSSPKASPQQGTDRDRRPQQNSGKQRPDKRSGNHTPQKPSYTINDLLSKFNS